MAKKSKGSKSKKKAKKPKPSPDEPQPPENESSPLPPSGTGDEPNNPLTQPSTIKKKKTSSPIPSESLHSVHFEGEEGTATDRPPKEEEVFLQGNWPHFKPTARFDYQDLGHRKDKLFGVNVATECETYFRAQRIRTNEKTTEHFAFIVDLDAYEYHKVVFHMFLNEILESNFFRWV